MTWSALNVSPAVLHWIVVMATFGDAFSAFWLHKSFLEPLSGPEQKLMQLLSAAI